MHTVLLACCTYILRWCGSYAWCDSSCRGNSLKTACIQPLLACSAYITSVLAICVVCAACEQEAASLNSGDAFILVIPSTVFVWQGNGCSDAEESVAMAIGTKLGGSRTLTELKEVPHTAAAPAALALTGLIDCLYPWA